MPFSQSWRLLCPKKQQISSFVKQIGNHSFIKDILKHHAVFLSNARPAVFEIDLDDPLQNPTLLEELKRQLDGIDIQQSPDKPEAIVEEEKHKE